MIETLNRLEAALQRHAPSVYAGLRPPASDAQIAVAERALGVTLPEDVRAAYRWHDGCASELSIFVDVTQWCSLEEMANNWAMMVRVSTANREITPGNYPEPAPWWDELKVKPVWWNQRWVPIGTSTTSSSIYVDLDPAPAGIGGQLIADDGMIDARVMAPSLKSFFRNLAAYLEEGRLSEGADGTWGEIKPRLAVSWSRFDWSK